MYDRSGPVYTAPQTYATMPMGELGRSTLMPQTGSADAPPSLLPMTHVGRYGPNSAYKQLYDRLGGAAHDNSYAAEKSLIEQAAYANNPYNADLSDEEYSSLMPPMPSATSDNPEANDASTYVPEIAIARTAVFVSVRGRLS